MRVLASLAFAVAFASANALAQTTANAPTSPAATPPLATTRAVDDKAWSFSTTFKIDEVDDRTAFVTVIDDYTFRAKDRKVHNVIQSRFRFQNGSIVEQHDSCDSRKWASMAIGGVGGFLAGRIPLLRGAKARRTLATFVKTHPQYKES